MGNGGATLSELVEECGLTWVVYATQGKGDAAVAALSDLKKQLLPRLTRASGAVVGTNQGAAAETAFVTLFVGPPSQWDSEADNAALIGARRAPELSTYKIAYEDALHTLEVRVGRASVTMKYLAHDDALILTYAGLVAPRDWYDHTHHIPASKWLSLFSNMLAIGCRASTLLLYHWRRRSVCTTRRGGWMCV